MICRTASDLCLIARGEMVGSRQSDVTLTARRAAYNVTKIKTVAPKGDFEPEGLTVSIFAKLCYTSTWHAILGAFGLSLVEQEESLDFGMRSACTLTAGFERNCFRDAVLDYCPTKHPELCK